MCSIPTKKGTIPNDIKTVISPPTKIAFKDKNTVKIKIP